MELPPIMIYGDDVTHILTEEGIANLLLCRSDEEREQAIRGVAGYTAVGLARDRRAVENLRDRGVIRRPQDLGIDPRQATRNLLAARSMRDLVRASGGLYQPPQALPQLVSRRLDDERRSRRASKPWTSPSPAAGRPAPSRRCWSASSAPATSRCCSSRRPAPTARCVSRRRRAASARSGRPWCATSTQRHPLAGVRVSINDMGATPAVVSLRLDQAVAGDQP